MLEVKVRGDKAAERTAKITVLTEDVEVRVGSVGFL